MQRNEVHTWIGESFGNQRARSADKKFVRLSCFSTEERWFFTMESHGNFGVFLDVLSIAAIIMYFVTSSDSGSYIIDMLGSNGDLEPPTLQRVFWALTEGGAATALLVAGGKDALQALQTVSIVCGLPYTFVICFLCVALWRACGVSYRDLDAQAPDFPVGYLDFATEFKLDIIGEWLLAFILGPYWSAKAAVRVWKMKDFMTFIFAGIAYFLLLCFVVLYPLHWVEHEFWAFAWTCFFGFATIIGACRTAVRVDRDYIGNPVEDWFAALFLYPSVGQQLRRCDNEVKPMANNLAHAENGHAQKEMEPPTYKFWNRWWL